MFNSVRATPMSSRGGSGSAGDMPMYKGVGTSRVVMCGVPGERFAVNIGATIDLRFGSGPRFGSSNPHGAINSLGAEPWSYIRSVM